MSMDQERPENIQMGADLRQSREEEGFADLSNAYIGPVVQTEDDAAADTAHKKSKRKVPYFKLIVSAVLSLLLIFYFIVNRETAAPVLTFQAENAIRIYSDEKAQVTYIYNSRGEQVNKVDLQAVHYIYNLDHSAAAVFFLEKYTGISLYSLYYVNLKEAVLIKTGVHYMAISDQGSYVMYSQKLTDGSSALYLYDIRNKKEQIIDSGKLSYSSLCFSPDENTLLFASEYISTNNRKIVEGFIIRDISSGNLEPVSIGVDRLPIAVSNQAKFIYFGLCINFSPSHLYVKYMDETIKLADNYTMVILNKDHTEIIYNDGEATKLCLRGTESLELSKKTLIPVMPYKGTSKRDFMYLRYAYTFGTESFRNMVILTEEGDLLLLNDQYQLVQIDQVDAMELIALSKDANSVTYMNSEGTLKQVSNLRGEWKTKTLQENLDHWVGSKDLAHMYYIRDKKLYYCKDKEEPQLVMEGADRLYPQDNGTDIYVLTGEKGAWNLYSCSQGVPSEVEAVDVIKSIMYSTNGSRYRQNLEDDGNRYYYPNLVIYSEDSLIIE